MTAILRLRLLLTLVALASPVWVLAATAKQQLERIADEQDIIPLDISGIELVPVARVEAAASVTGEHPFRIRVRTSNIHGMDGVKVRSLEQDVELKMGDNPAMHFQVVFNQHMAYVSSWAFSNETKYVEDVKSVDVVFNLRECKPSKELCHEGDYVLELKSKSGTRPYRNDANFEITHSTIVLPGSLGKKVTNLEAGAVLRHTTSQASEYDALVRFGCNLTIERVQ